MMKRIMILIMITATILGLAACSGHSAETQAAGTPTATQAAPAPAKIAAPYPKALPTAAATLPCLLGEKWYDWESAGAYPGASITQCGDRIAFLKPVVDRENGCIDYLAFADPDGSNCVCAEVIFPRCLNYKDGWVYYIAYGYSSIKK